MKRLIFTCLMLFFSLISMAQYQEIYNGELGSSVRTKMNSMHQELYNLFSTVCDSLGYNPASGYLKLYNSGNFLDSAFLMVERDTSSTNELQVLTISNDTVFLSNGGFIKLPAETDPAYTASQAANIDATDITNLGNLSGINTGDQDLSGLATKTALADSTAQVRSEIPDISGFVSTSELSDTSAAIRGDFPTSPWTVNSSTQITYPHETVMDSVRFQYLRAIDGTLKMIVNNSTGTVSFRNSILDLDLYRIQNLGTPVYSHDAATKAYVDAATGSALTIKEQDGSPDISATTLKVTNGTLTDDGSGVASLAVFASPLTTKGDIQTYSTTPARLGVGTDGQVLTASSSAPTGLAWATPSSSIWSYTSGIGYTTASAYPLVLLNTQGLAFVTGYGLSTEFYLGKNSSTYWMGYGATNMFGFKSDGTLNFWTRNISGLQNTLTNDSTKIPTSYAVSAAISAAGGGTVTSVGLSSTDLTVTGSPITSAGTITANLAASGVTAGSYTNANITVNSKGIVTAASSGSSGGSVSISAGDGMSFTTITGTGAVAMGTPSSITSSSGNATSGTTHSHAISIAAADATTKGIATFATNDFNSSSGLVSIDYTNGQAASSSAKGFLSAADWLVFNAKDNYQRWKLKVNGAIAENIYSLDSVNFATTGKTTISFTDLTNTVNISSPDSVFDFDGVNRSGWSEGKVLKFDSSGNLVVGTDNVGEGGGIALTDLSATSPLSYNNTTGAFSVASGYSIPTSTQLSNFSTAYGWGNHATAGYLTSFTETDPVFAAWDKDYTDLINKPDSVFDFSGINRSGWTEGSVLKFNASGNLVVGTDNVGEGGTGAPTDATYITQTANSSLSAEQALSSLSTGIVKVTTGTGVLSSVTAPSGAILGDTDSQTITNKTITTPLLQLSQTASNAAVQGNIRWDNDNKNIEVANGSSFIVFPDSTDIAQLLNGKQNTLTTGNLTESITGLEFDQTRQVIGGSATLSLTTGYAIPTTTQLSSYLTAEVDGSATNEIQHPDTFAVDGSTLILSLSSDGVPAKTVDLSSLAGGSSLWQDLTNAIAPATSTDTVRVGATSVLEGWGMLQVTGRAVVDDDLYLIGSDSPSFVMGTESAGKLQLSFTDSNSKGHISFGTSGWRGTVNDLMTFESSQVTFNQDVLMSSTDDATPSEISYKLLQSSTGEIVRGSPENDYITLYCNATISAGDWCVMGSSGMVLADADAESTTGGLIGRATASTTAGNSIPFMVRGKLTGLSGLTRGTQYYISATAGGYTSTAPSSATQCVRILGWAISSTEIYFDPDKSYILRK